MSELHQAVARAIAPWLDAAPKFAYAPDEIRTHRYGRAANAVLAVAEPAIRADERRVCLAEAQRAVGEIKADWDHWYNSPGGDPGAESGAIHAADQVLAALAALGE